MKTTLMQEQKGATRNANTSPGVSATSYRNAGDEPSLFSFAVDEVWISKMLRRIVPDGEFTYFMPTGILDIII